MLRYKYENSIDMKVPSCRECLKFSSCNRYTRKLSNFGACMDGSFKYKEPEITTSNAFWFINQIMKDTQLAKIGAEKIIEQHRANWIRPESLKYSEFEIGPSFIEAYGFKLVMHQFLHLILDRKKEYSSASDYKTSQVAFVNSIIKTRIKIEENNIKLFAYNEELVEKIKNSLKNENYNLKIINNINDMGF